MFRGRGEGLAFLQRTVPFLPTMIDAIKQRLERRNIVRSKQPLVIVDACEDEMRYADRLDLVLLVKRLSRVSCPPFSPGNSSQVARRIFAPLPGTDRNESRRSILVRCSRSTSGRGNRASARAGENPPLSCDRFPSSADVPTVFAARPVPTVRARSDKDRSHASASASAGNPTTRPVEASLVVGVPAPRRGASPSVSASPPTRPPRPPGR